MFASWVIAAENGLWMENSTWALGEQLKKGQGVINIWIGGV